jgi:hypothetical protein
MHSSEPPKEQLSKGGHSEARKELWCLFGKTYLGLAALWMAKGSWKTWRKAKLSFGRMERREGVLR